jgi:hypothetical protein
LYYRSGNVSHLETVLTPCPYALLDFVLQAGDDRLRALHVPDFAVTVASKAFLGLLDIYGST